MKTRLLAIAALLSTSTVHAGEAPDAAPSPHSAGAGTTVEADFLMGTFTGGRLQGIVYQGSSYSINVEGLYGSNLLVFQPFSDGSSTAWGGGVRLNHPFSGNGGNGWSVAPGVDFYDANSHGASFVSPNVDFAYTHDFSSHFGLAFGFKGGVEYGLSGHSDQGDSYSGKSVADLGVYVGARF